MVIPAGGEPLGEAGTDPLPSATEVAQLLAEAFEHADEAPALDNISSVIPTGFTESERDVIRRFIGMMRAYGEVFDENGLLSKADVSIFSVGSFRQAWEHWGDRLFTKGKVAQSYMADLFAGDIGGYPVAIRRPGQTQSEAKDMKAIQSQWMAMRLDDYQRIAAKAAEAGGGGPAGSVLLAVDENKSDITARVIEEGAVSRLGCDISLAVALCDKFGVPRPPRPGGGDTE